METRYKCASRLWWIYHTLCNHQALRAKENAKHNYLSKFWWFYIFRYFEGNVRRPLPNRFGWPLPKFAIRLVPAPIRRVMCCGETEQEEEEQQQQQPRDAADQV